MRLRRAAIVSQVRRKAATDLALLYDCIEPNRADREFFIRKGIGWALRAYAWVDPDEIERYCATHELMPLSRREALRNIVRLLASPPRSQRPATMRGKMDGAGWTAARLDEVEALPWHSTELTWRPLRAVLRTHIAGIVLAPSRPTAPGRISSRPIRRSAPGAAMRRSTW